MSLKTTASRGVAASPRQSNQSIFSGTGEEREEEMGFIPADIEDNVIVDSQQRTVIHCGKMIGVLGGGSPFR